MSEGTALSRRGVIAALAAGAAVNLPVIAATATAPPAVTHPDRVLLDLGRQYDRALGAEDAALGRWTAACDVYAAAEPAMPGTLRHRMGDHFHYRFPVLGETRTITDNEHSDYYNDAEVEVLRTAPRTNRIGYIVDKATGAQREAFDGSPFNEVTEEKHLRSVPDLDAQARADEIVTAWDGHQAACGALAASLGCHDAEGGYYDAVRARQAIGGEIVAAQATTLAGLAVRARIVSDMLDTDDEPDDVCLDDRMMLAIVRDLAAMAPSV